MKKSLKNIVQLKIATLNQEVANLSTLEQKISEQMTKVQLGKVKAQAAMLVLQQILDEAAQNG
jgi:hypothetical protein